MAYTDHIAPSYLAPEVTTPGVAALQRNVLWFVGMGGAIVMIEPRVLTNWRRSRP